VARHDRLHLGHAALVGAHGDEVAAAAHALGVDVGVLLADAGLGQRAEQAAGRRAGARAGDGRHQPARRDDGAEARDRQGADAGEQAGAAAHDGAERGAGASARCRTGFAFGDRIVARNGVVGIRAVGDQADIVMGEAGGLQVAHGGRGVGIAVEEACDCSAVHLVSPFIVGARARVRGGPGKRAGGAAQARGGVLSGW
jgi:hypothetical protein